MIFLKIDMLFSISHSPTTRHSPPTGKTKKNSLGFECQKISPVLIDSLFLKYIAMTHDMTGVKLMWDVQVGCSPCGCDSPAAGEGSGSSSLLAACREWAWPGDAVDQSSGRQRGSSSHGPTPPSAERPGTTTGTHEKSAGVRMIVMCLLNMLHLLPCRNKGNTLKYNIIWIA